MSPSLRERAAAGSSGTTTRQSPAAGGPLAAEAHSAGTTEVVEAATAAAAIAEVQRRHGAAARILRAEKVLRGGLGGFFARELVQLTVDVATAEPPSSVAVVPPPDSGRRRGSRPDDQHDGANPIVAALSAGVEDGPPGETFGELLDRRAAAEGAVPGQRDAPTERTDAARHLGVVPGSSAATGSVPAPAAATDPVETAPSSGVARVVEQLARSTGSREESFGAALRAAIAADDAIASSPGGTDRVVTALEPDRRGAASLLDRSPGAARLVADADRVVRPGPAGTRRLSLADLLPDDAPPGSVGGRRAGTGRRIGAVRAAGAPAEVADRGGDVGGTRIGGSVADTDPAYVDVAAAPDGVAGTVDVGREAEATVVGRDAEATVVGRDAGATVDPAERSSVPSGGPAAGRGDVPDPLPARHEAIRQLRACAGRLGTRSGPRGTASAPVDRVTNGASARSDLTVDVTAGSARVRAASTWSGERLTLAGLPPALVEQVVAAAPVDDIGWFVAVARALEPLCPTLGAAAEVVVGPAAGAFSTPLGAPVVGLDERAAPRGSCTLATGRTTDARRWLAEERAGRSLHLVVGDGDWRGWLFETPDVVSWTAGHHLADALDVASRFGAALGWSLDDGVPRRATPLDVAIGLRDRVAER